MNTAALDLLDRFRRHLATERRASPHTIAAYALDLGELVRFCDRQGLGEWAQLDPGRVRDFGAWQYRRGVGARSIARRLSAVRTFCRFLVHERVLGANPAVDIRAPKAGKRLPAVLDVDQMTRLLDIQGTGAIAVRDRAIMELLYSSALRLIELIRLDVPDVDLRDRTARVLGKGNVARIVPVGRHAAQALEAWLRIRRAKDGEKALFVGRGGRRLGRRIVQVRLDYWARRQGIAQHVHPHMFRHSAATHLLEGCNDIRAIQEYLGHASISTTAIYAHMNFSQLAKAYDAAHPRARSKGSPVR